MEKRNIREITEAELDQVSGGSNKFTQTTTSVTTNPNGNVTNGQGESQTTTTTTLTTNSQGHVVPGQSSVTVT